MCRLKTEFSTPVIGVFISEVRNFDIHSFRISHGALSSKGTVHVTVTANYKSSSRGESESTIKSTTSRSVASTMQYHENLFFPLVIIQDLPLTVELCTDEHGCREVAFASATVKFNGEKYEGVLQMRDTNNDVIAVAAIHIGSVIMTYYRIYCVTNCLYPPAGYLMKMSLSMKHLSRMDRKKESLG